MAGRFVEKKDRCLLREPERNPNALTLARAQGREEASRKRIEAYRRERRRDRALVVGAGSPLPPTMVRNAPGRNDFGNAERFEDCFVAGDERDAPRPLEWP